MPFRFPTYVRIVLVWAFISVTTGCCLYWFSASYDLFATHPLYVTLILCALLFLLGLGVLLRIRSISMNELLHVLRKARSATERLEFTSKAKIRLFANMSNELREPLSGVLGALELAYDTKLTEEQKCYLGQVSKSAERVREFVNNIHDFSLIETGRFELARETFDLGDCVETTISRCENLFAPDAPGISCTIMPDVPLMLTGDERRLGILLVYLVRCVAPFTDEKAVHIRIQKDSRENDTVRLHFSLAIHGSDIPDDVLMDFSAAEKVVTGNYNGRVLGMAISVKIIDMMDGRTWIDRYDSDNEYVLHFTAAFGIARKYRPDRIPVDIDALNGIKVLIADANPADRFIYSEMLINRNLKPLTVESGLDVIQIVKKHMRAHRPFPFIIFDNVLPVIDGLELVEQLAREINPRYTKLIVLASQSYPGNEQKYRVAGVDAYLAKPVKKTRLINTLLEVATSLPADQLSPVPGRIKAGMGTRVLLIEDNKISQEVTRRMLVSRGYSVTVADDGSEGVSRWEQEAFDVILMDLQMPVMNGFQAAAAIREKEQFLNIHTPIIAVTAHTLGGYRDRCLQSGMDDYIAKPIDRNELYRLIEQHLQPTGKQPPAVDLFNIEDVLSRIGEDNELLRNLISIFLEDGNEKVKVIRRALAHEDFESVMREALSLKGSAGDISSRRLYSCASALEEAAETQDSTAAGKALDAIEETMSELTFVLNGLKNWCPVQYLEL
jgi:CheY-like chemotaxis protein/HPt (histidine-containing phosphotransfer) domain-containing protein